MASNQAGSNQTGRRTFHFVKATIGSSGVGIQIMDNSGLEEFDLFDSERIVGLEEGKEPQYNHVDAPAKAHVASPPSPPFYDPLGWSMDQVSPVGTDLFSSHQRNPRPRNEVNLVNAVHMHVQDNARIPNYNHPVDRSNSSTSKNFPRTNYKSDALLSSKIEQDNSMAEIFLSSESSYRKSLNQTYEVLGSLSTEDSNIQNQIEELAAVSVDPTPWSEIKERIHIEEEREKQKHHQQVQRHLQQEQLSVAASPPIAATSKPAPIGGIHSHQSNYYTYGRNHQLPIPEYSPPREMSEKSSSLGNNTAGEEVSRMAEAIATAAAIVCTNNVTTNIVDNTCISPAKQSKLAIVSGKESSTMASVQAMNQNKMQVDNICTHQPGLTNTSTYKVGSQSKMKQHHVARSDKTAASNRCLHRQRGNPNPPPHAAAHAVSRASVLAATNRKSQYGFGGNHIVPSVPAPPSIRSSTQPVVRQNIIRKNKQPSKKVPASSPIKPHTPVLRPPSTNPNGSHPTLHVESNTGSAYERKKQKAKDARVKLNESIERLAIAVSLAGSQSKQRIDQLQNQINITEYRKKSIAVNQEGIKLAENAKKWDRPSFVGTAASVIQSLNAQCEALMTELMAMQQLLDENKNSNKGINNDSEVKSKDLTSAKIIQDTIMAESSTEVRETIASKSINEKGENPTLCQAQKRYQQLAENPNKRPRLGIKEMENLPSNDEVIFGSIARMLDPQSLCRCTCTTKSWREMNAFKDETVWLNLAVKRFGFYNVRKWSENLKDRDHEELSNKHLYEEMNASNVMPHFSQEGLSYLGNGKIEGKLSGWVFIVERSNGETLRSVKRDPSSGVSGGVGYQSRPVVELRIVIQNTGMATQPIILKSQKVGVDVSTRRRGGELEEIYWDDRLKKNVRNMNGTIRTLSTKHSNNVSQDDLCWLGLFETAVIEVHINARGCSTISKFRQRSNFTKILASLDGTTVPMVIPFLKDDGML